MFNPQGIYDVQYGLQQLPFGSQLRPPGALLVLHYTAQNFADSVQSLTGKSVSAHYLVPDPEDPTYKAAGFSGVRIFNLVDEVERAWHAGTSQWGNRSNLNDTAIGIEIVNLASGDGEDITFPPFNPQQIAAVTQLTQNILQRYPDITPVNVVAHSDIAPGRKSDPGPQFPWHQLYKAGVGAWYDDAVKQRYQHEYQCQGYLQSKIYWRYLPGMGTTPRRRPMQRVTASWFAPSNCISVNGSMMV